MYTVFPSRYRILGEEGSYVKVDSRGAGISTWMKVQKVFPLIYRTVGRLIFCSDVRAEKIKEGL